MKDRETAPQEPLSDRDDNSVVRHEQELQIGKGIEQVGSVTARKHVDTSHVEHMVPRGIESADVERVPPAETDSGLIETLQDGSVSIPILEEELVITKRTVVRERIIIRKSTTTEQHKVEADLLVESVEIEGDDSLEHAGDDADSQPAT